MEINERQHDTVYIQEEEDIEKTVGVLKLKRYQQRRRIGHVLVIILIITAVQ